MMARDNRREGSRGKYAETATRSRPSAPLLRLHRLSDEPQRVAPLGIVPDSDQQHAEQR